MPFQPFPAIGSLLQSCGDTGRLSSAQSVRQVGTALESLPEFRFRHPGFRESPCRLTVSTVAKVNPKMINIAIGSHIGRVERAALHNEAPHGFQD